MSMQLPVGIVGASGYAGVELTRLLAGHPGVELAMVSSDRWAGDTAERHTGVAGTLRYSAPGEVVEHAARCAVVLLATPAEASHALVPELLARGTRVVDLSGAFRLRSAALYPLHYGFAHVHPALLAEAIYAIPELHRARVAGARLVANPGCYATAIQLALAPVIAHVTGRIIVDAMSGVTGAGRKATEEMSFAEIAGDVRAYRVLRHQHAPEIEQGLGAAISFVPHLLPVQRGILATCHTQLAPGVTAATIAAAFERYAHEPFVELAASASDVALHDVVGTNRCKLGFDIGESGELVVIAAIDNLVKGAAGQAVQNLNLLVGLDETTGLESLRSFYP